MGNRLNKIYEKAMDYYNNGYIERALEECEKGISLDLKNSKILNLKGILLYIKGDLKGAISVWKINSHYNDDEISKIYLKDSKNDEEKIQLYCSAERDIKEFKIDDAIRKLEICIESDFNSINVNNSLSVCYLRKANYMQAIDFNEKSLNIDKEGKKALEIKNEINSFLIDPKEEFKESIKKRMIIILVFLTFISIILGVLNKLTINKNEENLSIINENIDINEGADNQLLEENNLSEALEIENTEETTENIVVLNSNEEIEKAYEKSLDLFDEGKFNEAVEELKSAYNSKVDTYYKRHILFLLASCYYEENNHQEAIKYYEEYISKYDNTYLEEIYYKLALLYEEKDLNKSKEYANIVRNTFGKSIYNNSKISNIISK